MTRLSFAVAMLLLSTAASLGAAHSVSIVNKSSAAVSNFSVRGGTVDGFKPVNSSQTRSVTVTLPDGTCEASAHFAFTDGSDLDYGKFDFCTGDTLTVDD